MRVPASFARRELKHRLNMIQQTEEKHLERVHSIKLLGVQFDDLTWNEHITKSLASCYGTLSVPKKLK